MKFIYYPKNFYMPRMFKHIKSNVFVEQLFDLTSKNPDRYVYRSVGCISFFGKGVLTPSMVEDSTEWVEVNNSSEANATLEIRVKKLEMHIEDLYKLWF